MNLNVIWSSRSYESQAYLKVKVTQDQGRFNSIQIKKYQKYKILWDKSKGNKWYSSFEHVHNIRFCVNALVKQFPDKKLTWSWTFAAISVHIILFKTSVKNTNNKTTFLDKK